MEAQLSLQTNHTHTRTVYIVTYCQWLVWLLVLCGCITSSLMAEPVFQEQPVIIQTLLSPESCQNSYPIMRIWGPLLDTCWLCCPFMKISISTGIILICLSNTKWCVFKFRWCLNTHKLQDKTKNSVQSFHFLLKLRFLQLFIITWKDKIIHWVAENETLSLYSQQKHSTNSFKANN